MPTDFSVILSVLILCRDNLSLTYNGVPDLVVTLMLVTFALMSRTMEKKAMKNIDDGQQTPQDYSGALPGCLNASVGWWYCSGLAQSANGRYKHGLIAL